MLAALATALPVRAQRGAPGDDAAARAWVDAAAARRPPAEAAAGRLETELLVAVRREGGRDERHTTWRTASLVTIRPDGGVHQRIVGTRAVSTRMEPGDLRAFRRGWWIASLAGESFALHQRVAPTRTPRLAAPLLAGLARFAAGPETLLVVHPLARDRDRYYTVRTGTDGVVLVVPRADAPRDRARFRGSVRVDTAAGVLVEGRGRVDAPDGRIIGYVEWRDARGAGPPAWQRITLRHGGSSPFDPATRAMIVTRFVAADAPPAPPGPAAALVVAVDSSAALRTFTEWMPPLAAADDRDGLDDLLPDAEREVGAPRLDADRARPADTFRFDRVEGVFTGAALRYRLRDAAPGLVARASAGYAWAERAVRGRVGIERVRGDWRLHLGGARLLDPTDDFRAPHDSIATIPALLLSNEAFDWVDRRVVRAGVAHRLGGEAPAVGVQFGTLVDRAVRTHVDHGLTGGPFRPVRGVRPGHAVQMIVWFEHHPDAWTAVPAHPVGLRVRYDQGDGSIAWRRLQASVVAHRPLAPALGLQLEGHAGALLGGRAIPQQLFEVGGGDHLPPYRPKEFAGDRIVIARATLLHRLPWLRRPLPVVGGWVLPAPAPVLATGLNAAWTGATAVGRVAIAALGVRTDPATGAIVLRPDGTPERASRPTDGVRATTSLGVRLFGGAVFAGIGTGIDGRADAPRGVRWAFGFGGAL